MKLVERGGKQLWKMSFPTVLHVWERIIRFKDKSVMEPLGVYPSQDPEIIWS